MAKDGVAASERGDAAERLLAITLALLSSKHGLTKAEIFESVRDYRNAIAAKTSKDALEKKFERDKSDLRDSGIKIETLILASDGDDNQQTRYIIKPGEFSWPQGTQLTSSQLQLLNLAAQVWRQASLASDATAGLDRLRALGVTSDSASSIGIAPRLNTHEKCFLPLSNAVIDREQVSFEYRKPGSSEVTRRNVQPWKLRNVSGQWLLVCWDLDANDVRNFMLKRIIGRIKFTGKNFESPALEDIDQATSSLDKHIESQVATLSIKRDSMAWFHFEVSGSSEWSEIKFHYMDLWLLAEELRDFAGDFKVIGPSELADAIRVGFEKVAALHG
jgi:proteasome accessory factor B